LGEEHKLKVFENRVLRRIFGPKREEDGSWRKLHNDELHSLYSSIKMNLREIGIDGANWIHLARNRVRWRDFVNTVMNLRVP
jgi:hypothetical protein